VELSVGKSSETILIKTICWIVYPFFSKKLFHIAERKTGKGTETIKKTPLCFKERVPKQITLFIRKKRENKS